MTRKLFSAMVVAIVSLLTFTSCKEEPTKLIVGTWNLSSAEIVVGGFSMEMDAEMMAEFSSIVFNADGTCSVKGGDASNEIASYVVSEDGKTLAVSLAGETINFTIVQLDKNNLILTSDQAIAGQQMNITLTFTR